MFKSFPILLGDIFRKGQGMRDREYLCQWALNL